MKIAILGTRGIPAKYGGFETFSEELSVRLVSAGVHVTVYCERSRQHSPKVYKGVRLAHIPVLPLGPLATIIFDIFCLWHAKKGFDVVYMLGYGASPFCVLPRLWGSQVWLNPDGLEWARAKWNMPARLWFRIMEAFAAKVPNMLIMDSEKIRDYFLSKYRWLPKYTVIPYGADTPVLNPSPSEISMFGLLPKDYYLIVCRLEPENHVLEMIKGFSLSTTKKKLVVVGDHKLKTPYVRQIKQSVGDRIILVGSVYEKPAILALRYHCFVYFHGHSVGGTNPSLLEALACGNPVIAHDNPFNREVAREAAVYFKQPDSIPKLIGELESNELSRMQMAEQAIIRIETHYTWERVTSEYMNILKETER